MPCCLLDGIPHTHGVVLCKNLIYRRCGVGFPPQGNSIIVISNPVKVNDLMKKIDLNSANLYHMAILQFLSDYNEKWSLSECAQN